MADNTSTTKSNKPKFPRRQERVIITNGYSEEDDFEVEHSGIVDQTTGRPKYDHAKIKGGCYKVGNKWVNSKGQEINPTTGEVINPDQYKTEEDF